MAVGRVTLDNLSPWLKSQTIGRVISIENVWKRSAIPVAKKLVDESLTKGVSPVEFGGNNSSGKPRFSEYSKMYQEKIRSGKYPGKRLRPINLRLTGKMRSSLVGRGTKEGFSLFYTDWKAKYHNDEGAGRSRTIRQILPNDKQNFSRTITRQLAELYVNLFERLR